MRGHLHMGSTCHKLHTFAELVVLHPCFVDLLFSKRLSFPLKIRVAIKSAPSAHSSRSDVLFHGCVVIEELQLHL
jgi:hypothetical protein